MGLDSYLYERKIDDKSLILERLDEDLEGGMNLTEIIYWRKHFIIDGIFTTLTDCENCENKLVDRDLLETAIEILEEHIKKGDKDEYYSNEELNEELIKLKELLESFDFENKELYFHHWY